MNILKTAALIAAGLIAVAGCQQGAVDTTADVTAIRAGTAAFADAYNAGDADALAAAYTEDAVILPPNAPAVSGREGIREYWAADSASARAAGLKFVFPGDGPAEVSGDLAYESGSFQVVDASGAAVATGKYIGVFKKVDGKWLLVRDTWNTDAAPAAEPAAGRQRSKGTSLQEGTVTFRKVTSPLSPLEFPEHADRRDHWQ